MQKSLNEPGSKQCENISFVFKVNEGAWVVGSKGRRLVTAEQF